MRNQLWFGAGPPAVVPLGIILPFNDVAANIPTGWGQFGLDGIFDANKFIKGSDGTVAAGGSNSFYMISSAGGSHTGDSISGFLVKTETGSNVNYPPKTAAARGSHTHTTYLTWEPAKREQILIKSTEDSYKLPVNTGVFSINSQSGMTDITPTGDTLGLQRGSTNASIAIQKATPASNSLGLHHHFDSLTGASTTNYGTNYYQGTSANWAHTSTVSTVTDSIQRFYFSIWSSASSEIQLGEGMFGMWESATPPDGWGICDGTLGIPDLVDYFIGLDTSKAGTSDGDGTLYASGSLASTGSHGHKVTSVSVYSSTANHTVGYAHSHTQSRTGAFEPEHYTLIFIKYLG